MTRVICLLIIYVLGGTALSQTSPMERAASALESIDRRQEIDRQDEFNRRYERYQQQSATMTIAQMRDYIQQIQAYTSNLESLSIGQKKKIESLEKALADTKKKLAAKPKPQRNGPPPPQDIAKKEELMEALCDGDKDQAERLLTAMLDEYRFRKNIDEKKKVSINVK